MILFIITLVGSIVAGIAVIAALLALFVKKVLRNRTDLLARVIVGLLVIQFILGMLSNLFVQIPDSQPYNVFHYMGPILLHTANALFLIILSSIFLFHAIRAKKSVLLGSIGLLSIATALFCGVVFVNAGQNDLYSFIMSLGFIIAFTVYAQIAFAVTPRLPRRTKS